MDALSMDMIPGLVILGSGPSQFNDSPRVLVQEQMEKRSGDAAIEVFSY